VSQNFPGKTVFLVGNKLDLSDDKRIVTVEEGQKLAEENNMKFYEGSGQNGENVEEIFIQMEEKVYENIINLYLKYLQIFDKINNKNEEKYFYNNFKEDLIKLNTKFNNYSQIEKESFLNIIDLFLEDLNSKSVLIKNLKIKNIEIENEIPNFDEKFKNLENILENYNEKINELEEEKKSNSNKILNNKNEIKKRNENLINNYQNLSNNEFNDYLNENNEIFKNMKKIYGKKIVEKVQKIKKEKLYENKIVNHLNKKNIINNFYNFMKNYTNNLNNLNENCENINND
jgi:hypothetical protein